MPCCTYVDENVSMSRFSKLKTQSSFFFFPSLPFSFFFFSFQYFYRVRTRYWKRRKRLASNFDNLPQGFSDISWHDGLKSKWHSSRVVLKKIYDTRSRRKIKRRIVWNLYTTYGNLTRILPIMKFFEKSYSVTRLLHGFTRAICENWPGSTCRRVLVKSYSLSRK